MSDIEHTQVNQPATGTPRSSLGSGVLSSSGSSTTTSSTSSGFFQGSAKLAVSECLSAWLNYLQMLNNLCGSGHRLVQTINALEQFSIPIDPVKQSQGLSGIVGNQSVNNSSSSSFLCAWEDLARATTVASATVKSHVISILQDFITQPLNPLEQDQDRYREHNQQIILETMQTMINVQHQFCAASYSSFAPLMCCYMCQAPVNFPHDTDCTVSSAQQATNLVQRMTGCDPRSQTPSPHFIIDPNLRHSPQHEPTETSPTQYILDHMGGPFPNPGQLLSMKTPFFRNSRSPLNVPLFPINGQRRWSEAAAGDVGAGQDIDPETQMRRWSMPWEATTKSDKRTVTWSQTRMALNSKLSIPKTSSKITNSDRSLSTTPDSIWAPPSTASQDGLAEAIQLLSCRPIRAHQVATTALPFDTSFAEEPQRESDSYEMWTNNKGSENYPKIKFHRDVQNKDF